MKEFLTVGFGLALIVAILCISPLVILWSINTLSFAAGLSFYIPHSISTYLAVIGLLLFLKGNVKNE